MQLRLLLCAEKKLISIKMNYNIFYSKINLVLCFTCKLYQSFISKLAYEHTGFILRLTEFLNKIDVDAYRAVFLSNVACLINVANEDKCADLEYLLLYGM